MQISRRELNGFLLASPFFLSSCGVLSDIVFRYRLTVNVRTPQGLSTGSSVIEIRSSGGSSWLGSDASTVRAEIIGEAVTVKLPSGELLFALLTSPTGGAPSYPFYGYEDDLHKLGKNMNWKDRTKALQKMSGVRKLSVPQYPMFVRFANIANPASIELVDPAFFSDIFGNNYFVLSVTVEITHDRLTSGIQNTLPWIPNYHDKMLDGQRLSRGTNFANGMSPFNFTQGM